MLQINPKQIAHNIVLGSVVFTDKGNFYIGVSIGKIKVEGEQFFAISPASPIGKLLLTKKEKESLSFNNKSYVINKVD